jgi:riboflavin kinase
MPSNFELLLYLYENKKSEIFTTSMLAKIFRVSQQSVSRKLRELEDKNLIKREVVLKGTKVILTKKGVDLLRDMQHRLNKIFGEISREHIEGELFSGIGDGKYYLSMKQYVCQVLEKLGFVPYPGTLNLKVDYSKLQEFVSDMHIITINGFHTEERTFGNLRAYRICINKMVEGAIVIPERTHYERNILEIIAPVSVRKHFHLKDGDKVKIFR